MTSSQVRLTAAAIVVIPLIGYPLAVGAVGAPFHSQDDCVRIASPNGTDALDLVFGRRDTAAEAQELLERVQGVGYVDAEMRLDGCGRWEVLYDGITSYPQGLESRTEARGAGLEAEIEVEPPG
jgi:hypothetical protein